MNAFHVIGILASVWAVLLTAVGLRRESFPGPRGERAVVAISALAVAGTIGSGIISSAVEEAEEHEKHAEEEKHAMAREAAGSVLPGGARRVELSADPGGELSFDTDRLEVAPGKTTIFMANPSPLSHNLVIEGNGVEQEGITVGKGGTSTVSADLKPGVYLFYCSVLGHYEGGMEGTLIVE